MGQFGSYGLAISPSSTLDLIEICLLVVLPGRCGLLVLLGLCRLLVLLKLCELVALLALASLSRLSTISAPSCLSVSGAFLAPFSCTALLASVCLIALAISLRFSPSPSRMSMRTRQKSWNNMARIEFDVWAAVHLVALFVDGRSSCHSREVRFAACHHIVAVGPSPIRGLDLHNTALVITERACADV